jgi:hypothetical protein
MNIKKETKSAIILIIILAISIALFSAISFGMEIAKGSTNFWTFFFIYFVVFIILNLLTTKFKNKTFEIFVSIFSLPFALIFGALHLVIPTISIFVHSFYYFILSVAIPFLLVRLNEYYPIIEISKENKTFIQLTFSIIIAVTFHKIILDLTYRTSPFRLKSSKKMKKFRLDELIAHIINKENIRFVIYISFFIYLVVYSYKMLGNSSILETSLHDKAILQSFLCFLAFDRVILNSKQVVLLPSIFLNKLMNSITQKEKDELEKENAEEK